jgi:hypothetical protein
MLWRVSSLWMPEGQVSAATDDVSHRRALRIRLLQYRLRKSGHLNVQEHLKMHRQIRRMFDLPGDGRNVGLLPERRYMRGRQVLRKGHQGLHARDHRQDRLLSGLAMRAAAAPS